jgi:hypothetical protein
MAPGDYIQALHLQLLAPEYVGFDGVCECAHRVAVAEDFNHLLHRQAAGREMTIINDGMGSCLGKFCKKCEGVKGDDMGATWGALSVHYGYRCQDRLGNRVLGGCDDYQPGSDFLCARNGDRQARGERVGFKLCRWARSGAE